MIKRFLKLIISSCLIVIDWLQSKLVGLTGSHLPGKCIVLCYHSVKPEEVERFRQQMKIIHLYTDPLPADFAGELQPGKKYVVLTFDDGFQNVITNALPILSEYKIPATLFLVTQYLGSMPNWIVEKDHPDLGERILHIEELKSINNDLVTFGSHSVSHPYMTKLSETEARKELTESKERLKNILRYDIKMFAFPHGDHSKILIDLANESGYQRLFTLSYEPAFSKADEFVTGRTDVYMDESLLEFKLKLLGAYRWLSFVFRFKKNSIVSNTIRCKLFDRG